jgi:ribosomal protein S18 acetylase RimI-like enzyme
MSKPNIAIRAIGPDERAGWEPLWKGYLEFYQSSQSASQTEITWARMHDPAETMYALGAYDGEELRGIVHYLFHRSFWTTGDYCYLQDLFVSEQARGRGFGQALIEGVAEKALEAGASRVYWLTREDNHAARALYDKLAERTGFIQYRRSL